jgi:hypothetical protein
MLYRLMFRISAISFVNQSRSGSTTAAAASC